ncbi:MAG TPA: heme exporter protein CcmD [Burkholderiaceae bacterium]|nr:heme exporter protein CcmD [Burkholderiaceae bacterium]
MNWGSWDAFWAMGGYGLYVWGSYAVAVAVAAIEIWQLRARRRAAVAEAVRESARARSAA